MMPSWGEECLEQPPQTQFADAVVRQPLHKRALEAEERALEAEKRYSELEAQLAGLREENRKLQKCVETARDELKRLEENRALLKRLETAESELERMKAELSRKMPDIQSLFELQQSLDLRERMLESQIVRNSLWHQSVSPSVMHREAELELRKAELDRREAELVRREAELRKTISDA
jgi:DNA repair exonuclease SbcCD ATPase subunit